MIPSTTKTFYIALGSNKGDKLKYLQQAVDLIFERIGAINAISNLYKTPAFGFKGDDFINCCLALKTDYRPQEVLAMLLAIETDLGRTRTTPGVYEARPIDLDIIFVEQCVIDTDALKVPHPELHKRKFVLQPLCDIAGQNKHPLYNKTVEQLLVACKDTSVLTLIEAQLSNPLARFTKYKFNYIAIEGNIGAGKTSLATKIATDFNANLVLERFADNPFLPEFYKNAERYAFPLEMCFLKDRYQQITKDMLSLSTNGKRIVSDYSIYKSLIFSKINLEAKEFELYEALFKIMFKAVTKPKVYVYLQQHTLQLQQNIKQRGRSYEQQISNTYLDDIHKGYMDFLSTEKGINSKIIDMSNRDFINNRADYLWVLDKIFTS